ncbi:MAG: efflux RND transporter permease subunit [Bacteroidota bacterium]
MKKIISYFIRHAISADVLVILILLFGVLGLASMRSTFFPETETKLISINIPFPGASPEEMEEGVILKIEDNLSGISGIETITSLSQENSGSVRVQIKDGYDIDEVLTDVKNAVDRISSFPAGMEPAVISKSEVLTNAINFAISGELDLRTLKQFADDVEDDLLASENISKVSVAGFPAEEVLISVRENDLRRFNLTFDQVANAVRAANIEISGGTIKGSTEDLLIRSKNKRYYAKDFEEFVVATNPEGRQVKLYEVADVKDAWSEATNRVYVNGKPAAYINVNNTSDENLLTISAEVGEYIETFNEKNSIVKAEIVNDGAVELRERVNLLSENGIVGFILVVILLAMFLQIRLAFWVALAIPVSFMGMFILAPLFGVSINMLSLFGMILVIGILVDDGIVISENIYRHFEMGKSRFDAAVEGTMEVLPAVTGAILTTIVAFAVFFFIDGTVGDFFSEISVVVILTLAFSLLEGAFVLPAHVSHSKALNPPEEKQEEKTLIGKWFQKLQQSLWGAMEWMKTKFYEPILLFFLRNTVLGIAIPIGLLMLSISLFAGGFVEGTFFPNIESNFVTVTLKMPAGTPESVTQKGLDQIEDAVWAVNESYKEKRADKKDVVLIISKNLGASSGAGTLAAQDGAISATGGANSGSVLVNLMRGEDRNIKAIELIDAFRKETGIIFGAEQLSFSSATPFGDPVSISVRGQDLQELSAAVNEIKDEMAKMPELVDVRDNNQVGLKEINIKLNDKAYLLGLNPQFVIAQIRQGFFGAEVQRLQRGKDEVKVWVRYSKADRSSIGKLENMRIRTANGQAYPLKELVDLDFSRGIIAINHLDGDREIRITSDLASDDVQSSVANATIESQIIPAVLAKYPSVRYSMEGQVKESAKTATSAGQIMPFAFILILTIIIVTFRSWSQTIAVGLTLPFGFIGVIVGHAIMGKPISMLSMMGVFALIGVMVNDALVLVNAFNQLIREGKPFKEALHEAALSRFRPIFLTSLTTVAGLTPLLFETSFQAQFLIPVAISIAFGLAVATFIILVTLPVIMVMFNQYKGFVIWLWKGEWWDPTIIEPAYEGRKNQFGLWFSTSIAFVSLLFILSRIPALFS